MLVGFRCALRQHEVVADLMTLLSTELRDRERGGSGDAVRVVLPRKQG
jgi:hypothetical protein